LAISTVRSLSTVPLHFFGKYPFWFLGDPKFGLITATIPFSIFVIDQLLANTNTSLIKIVSIYLGIFIITYLGMCWVISVGLSASNDFYKDGQELSYDLRQISLNRIYLTCVAVSTALTLLIPLVTKIFTKKKGRSTQRP